MNPRRRRLRVAIWLIFFLLVLAFLVYQARSKEEFRSFEWSKFAAAFAQAQKSYLLLSLLAIYSTYAIRSWRWQSFARPAQVLRFRSLFSATVIGYSAVMLLGRAGELVRPVMIARKENVPLSSMMAVWAVERIFDALMVVLLLAGVLVFSPRALLVDTAHAQAVQVVRQAGLLATLGALAGLVLLWIYRVNPERLENLGNWLHRFLPARWHAGVDRTLRSFEDGLKFLRQTRTLLLAVAQSLGLWLVICFAFWAVCQSVGGEVARLPATAVVVLLFFAMLGSAVQVPGVGGGLQAATFIALTALYSVGVEVAASAAILLWVITFGAVILFGVPMLVVEGWSFGQLREMAKSEAPENAVSALRAAANAEAKVRAAP